MKLSNRFTVGLVSIVAGLISFYWGFSGLVQKTIPYLARIRAEHLTSIVDDVYTNIQKNETENTHSYSIYWFAVGGGFAANAGGLVLIAKPGHYFDFKITKAPKGLKRRNPEYRDYPQIKPYELDQFGRYKL